MATAFLRNQIIRNVRHFAVFSKDAALFTVRVGFSGESNPFCRRCRTWCCKAKAKQWQLWTIISSVVMDFYIHVTIRFNDICHVCFQSWHRRCRECIADRNGIRAFLCHMNITNMIQLWCFMAPRLYLFESELRATEELPVLLQFQHAVKQPADMAMNAASLRFSTKLQP